MTDAARSSTTLSTRRHTIPLRGKRFLFFFFFLYIQSLYLVSVFVTRFIISMFYYRRFNAFFVKLRQFHTARVVYSVGFTQPRFHGASVSHSVTCNERQFHAASLSRSVSFRAVESHASLLTGRGVSFKIVFSIISIRQVVYHGFVSVQRYISLWL